MMDLSRRRNEKNSLAVEEVEAAQEKKTERPTVLFNMAHVKEIEKNPKKN